MFKRGKNCSIFLKIGIFIAIFAIATIIAGCASSSARSESARPEEQTTPDSIPDDGLVQSNTGGAVTIEVKWLAEKAESLVGAKAEVISRLGLADHAQYLVRSHGELWSANCPEVLQPGETVNVASVDGIKLLVTRTGVKSNERHCH